MAGSVAPGLRASALFLLLLAGRTGPVWAESEPGKWTVDVNSETLKDNLQLFIFRKTLFTGSSIHLKVPSHDCPDSVQLKVSWYLRSSHCYNEIFSLTQENATSYFGSTSVMENGGSGFYVQHQYDIINCQKMNPNIFGLDQFEVRKTLEKLQEPQATQNSTGRRRRDASSSHPKPVAAGGASNKSSPHSSSDLVAETWEDAPYVFILRVQYDSSDSPKKTWSLKLQVSMKGPHDYISATDWPLMVFYMVMCITYVFMAMLWLVLSACYWRDLLRIQFWIGGVIFLGMLEKAAYYAEFQSIRYDGVSVHGAVVFAELLSSLKKTLARVLIIIASLGYGIIKPRLGALMHRVVAVGLLYLVFSSVEGLLQVNTDRGNPEKNLFLCQVVLAFIDSCVVWWIFVSLAQTMKLLKLRRNVVKLSLYRHFTNTLIFAVIASVVFIIWMMKTFTVSVCRSDWREIWIKEAFWRFLFSAMLLVIMFLWRPSANNQRYAFSPLVDEESEDEEKEPMMNEAFEGMKMRGTKNETNGAAKANKVDEDLKWAEENIPSSMADIALPPLLDSDEESQITHFEMSKMD